MKARLSLYRAVASLTLLGSTVAAGTVAFESGASAGTAKPLQWASQDETGSVQLAGQVPLVVSGKDQSLMSGLQTVGAVTPKGSISLNFGLPLRDQTGLNRLIVQEAKTHHELSRAQIYARFSPPAAQYTALRKWLTSEGFVVTHVGRDRLEMTARAPASTVERALRVQLNVYHSAAYTDDGVSVPAQDFYSNTTAPFVPARLGVQSVSGLSNIDQFFTDTQLTAAASSKSATAATSHALKPATRTGGYLPRDLRSMYDVQGTDGYGTGQTIGYTLWGAGEVQAATTEFAAVTGEPALTVDTPCTASGNSPTSPSSCTTTQESPNHLLNILENGNANNNYAGNDETGLDVETSHGMAPGVAEKYYLGDCSTTPSPGLTNADCNGSDVGLEDAIEDAASDATLSSVSDSWGYGGEAEWGNADPFLLATQNSFAIAAAAGTTFYFSTGDSGTYESGYPADSPYVVAVGGTTQFSTQSLTAASSGTATLSTEDTWAAGGSWCSNIEPRPAWQYGAGVTANATCSGRAVPDISAIADTNSSVYEVYSTGATTYRTGAVGGTSVAGPVMNGMEADTENFIANQSYSGSTPSIGFEGPIMYMLGNSGNYNSYFRDVLCGNDADPSGGPDGEAAQPGWDEATGWGAIDWDDYSTGYAMELGATGLSVPASLSQNYQWSCAKTPGNSTEHSISFPTSSVGFAVGTAASSPWPSTYLPSKAWGATNTFYTTSDGGTDWVPSNSDMLSVACTSTTNCVEVGDGGVIKVTTNSGSTWTAESTQFNQALTQVVCPSSTICYAAGDRGTVLKSSDGGVAWTALPSVDGNPIYGLSCPSTTVCFAVDDYAHVMTTVDGGLLWSMQSTPVTTAGIDVSGSGGPNPYAGLFGVSCTSVTTCVAVGGFPPTGETEPPIVTTTNAGDRNDWTLQDSNAGTGNYLMGVSCLPGTTTCYAVGYTGTIVTTTDLTDWSAMTSNTTETLTGITCLSTTSCVATGQGGTIDVLNGTTWTPTTTTLGSSAFLAGVTCVTANVCYSVGKQGVALGFDSTNVAGTVTQLAGGGTTQTMDSISCTSASTCETVGGAGTILGTTNGGQTWLPQTSGVATSVTLESVSCTGSDCVAAGTSGTILGTTNGGATWTPQTSGVTVTLDSVSCTSSTCVVVGAAASGSGTILTAANGGGTWTAQTSGTTAGLSAVTCVSGDCYAVGAIPSGTTTAVILASTNSGSSWAAQTSNAPQALSAIACVDSLDCFAGGAIGTVMATNTGGATWYQEGDPISGPLSALNAGPTSITAIDGAACSSTACFMGTGSSGNIMTTPLLTVTVNASSAYGSTPNLTDLPATDSEISYSPESEASSVTGTLTCSTTATSSSDVGSYPISGCSGLSANGYNVIYNYAGSSYVLGPQEGTSTTLSSSDNGAGIVVGQSVTYTAQVTGDGVGVPTGWVSFAGSNGTIAGCGDVALNESSPDVASCVTSYASPTTDEVTATYSGDTNFVGSASSSLQEVVSADSTTVDLTSTPEVAVTGQPVTLNASVLVDSPGSGTPTGTVEFFDGTTPIAGCSAVPLNGSADASCTVTYSSNAGSPRSLSAEYSGDANDYGSVSNTLSEPVAIATTITIAASPSSVTFPHVAKFTAKGLPKAATGTVDFSVGTTLLCQATVSNGAAACTPTSPIDAGSYTVTGSYSGDSVYAASTATTSLTVNQAATAVKAKASPVSGKYGSTVTVTASGLPSLATGTVTFTSTSNSTVLCTLPAGTTVACIVPGGLPVGTYPVTVQYSGDNNYLSSEVETYFTVVKASAPFSASASPASATASEDIMLSAADLPASATGSVAFVTGSTFLCDAPVSGGSASCQVPSGIGKGTHTVTATYSGDSNYLGSKATTHFTVT